MNAEQVWSWTDKRWESANSVAVEPKQQITNAAKHYLMWSMGRKMVIPALLGTASPSVALAAADEVATAASWAKMFAAAMGIADWLCVGVIMFAGASWMFGNRTKALEHLIGGASGYLVIRKALLIRDFLRGL